MPQESILAGSGSSSLIFLALGQWLDSSSRVLILDPTYGEYSHVLEDVIECRVDRLLLDPADGFRLEVERLEEKLGHGYDLVALVNPNNPTGRHIPRGTLESLLRRAPTSTRFWIDEAYSDYVGPNESLERFASNTVNVVVCKSMSKVYALSGLRVGYLCGHPDTISALRRFNPPWAVSLPGQMAAVAALHDPDYYQERYQETHFLRRQLADELDGLGVSNLVPGVANYLMFDLPAG